MHWQLIAGIDWFLTPGNWPLILEVALGIGMVIFVHELGHFAVAKACGVKCEKFYLGFDIGGWKLFKYKWGETEYGIGVLPLGGYVKMLGQDDNPSRLHEETERAKLKSAEGEAAGGAMEGDSVFDPRSYLAKNVPQRMAIISAGVIMNVIFAFVVSTIAYHLGVEQIACVVGKVFAGEPAWKAGLREGDTIVQIGDVKNPVFRDLQTGVALGDNIEDGVDFVVRRPGVEEPLSLKIFPKRRKLIPLIGMTNGHTNQVALVLPGALGPDSKSVDLKTGDRIVAVNGHEVSEGWQVDGELAENRGPAAITVERKEEQSSKDGAKEPADAKTPAKRLEVQLPAVPMRTFGVVMAMGKVVEVQDGSPADAAGIKAHDLIKEIDGQDPGDPMRLAERLRQRDEAAAKITIVRGGQTLTKDVVLDLNSFDNTMPGDDSPVAVPALGVALAVESEVAAVEPDSPAATAGIKPGDTVEKVRLLPPDEEIQTKKYGRKSLQEIKEIDFAKERNWPILFALVQQVLPETQVELQLKDKEPVKLNLKLSDDWFNRDRGLLFEPMLATQKAETLPQALGLGWSETKYSLSLVFRFLRKLLSGQVSVKGIGGPVEIARQAGATASEGLSPFLLFLGMLSANLAVLNFLPIPMLDGGHMVFLAAEGVRGKPVSERVVACFQFAGLFLLASLMVFVLLLDVGLIPRG
ncbi:MAG TPA: site-2 protease family protein [Pirellulales bacterium]|nr:site-2 protease family protein [Pirellulales bacterium]